MSRRHYWIAGFVLLALVGCSEGNGSATGEVPGAGIAGTLNGEPITNDEVIDLLAEQQNDLVRAAVKAVATNRLIEAEARSRGITVDELFQVEVAGKVAPPSDVEIRGFYESRKNNPQFGGQTLEQLRPQIAQYLAQQKRIARHAEFLNQLRAAAQVRVLIDVPRFEVNIPTGAPSKGPAEAAVTIVEFADFECPACRSAQPALDRLLSDYAGRVRLVFRDFPLPNHARAVPASEAAFCAAAQDRFWEYHGSLMQGPLENADLKRRARDLGLDASKFDACFDAREHAAEVQDGFNQGRSLGINSTPTFFVNGRRVVGMSSYEEFKEIVEEELERAEVG